MLMEVTTTSKAGNILFINIESTLDLTPQR
jgi:hypothetical protein